MLMQLQIRSLHVQCACEPSASPIPRLFLYLPLPAHGRSHMTEIKSQEQWLLLRNLPHIKLAQDFAFDFVWKIDCSTQRWNLGWKLSKLNECTEMYQSALRSRAGASSGLTPLANVMTSYLSASHQSPTKSFSTGCCVCWHSRRNKSWIFVCFPFS